VFNVNALNTEKESGLFSEASIIHKKIVERSWGFVPMNAAGDLLPQTSPKKGCEFSSTSTTGCRHCCNPSPCVTTNSSQCKATEINRFDQPLLQQHSKPIQYFSKFANYVEVSLWCCKTQHFPKQ
jgi:hypothetical protein